jgi:hypothetical protein
MEGAAGGRRERMTGGRRRDSFLYVGGVVVWYGASIVLRDVAPYVNLPGGLHTALRVALLAGVVVSVCALASFTIREMRLRSDPVLRKSMRDEFAKQVKLRAAAGAFFAVLLAQIAIGLTVSVWPALRVFPVTLIPELTIYVGLIALAVGVFVFGRD